MGSYKNMARKVQTRGAKNTPNDSILAHITSSEAALLKARGGSGHTDPHTGLPHFDDGAGPNGDGMSGMSDGSIGGINGGLGPEGTFGDAGFDAEGFDSSPLGLSMSLGNPANVGEDSDFNETGFDDSPMGQELNEALGKQGKSPMSTITSFLTNQALGKALGQAAPVAGIAMSGGKGPAGFGSAFGGALGGMLGTGIAGPLGGIAGSAIGNGLGGIMSGVDNASLNGQGPANASAAAANGSMGGTAMGDLFGGLAGQYIGNRAAGQYNQTLGSLNDIFSPNGVYAQQLRQQLERRDAAGGRRSQYGPREAQLMAALAQHQAQTLSSPGYANMMQQRNQAQNQGLNTLFGLAQKSGLFNQIGNGVQGVMNGGGLPSLFNGGYSNAWALGPNAGPQPDFGGGFDFGGSGLMDGGMWGG